MSKTTRQYLEDMLSYTYKITDFTVMGRETFISDEKTQFAVIRAYEVIGEIVKRLPAGLLELQPQIKWQDIKGFRDFLAHNYDRVRLDILWSAVEKLPELQDAVKELLAGLPEE